ncbi:MAG: Yip1 family protein [Gammaproteobacteria bacterium]|nr:Yip1 family protein [Gammaproteobacteria bacterium]
MFFEDFWNLVYRPKPTWRKIRKHKYGLRHSFFTQLSWMAAIPAMSFFIGTTQMGWSLGNSDYHTLTIASALPISITMYFTLIAIVAGLGAGIYSMERTYGAHSGLRNCMVLATFVASPMLGAGIVGLWPVVWVTVFVMLIALCVSLYFLFTGIPVMMKVSEERGFLFSISVVTLALCFLVALIAVSVIAYSNWLPLTLS